MSNNFKSLNFISHKNNYIIESINIIGSEDDFFYIKKNDRVTFRGINFDGCYLRIIMNEDECTIYQNKFKYLNDENTYACDIYNPTWYFGTSNNNYHKDKLCRIEILDKHKNIIYESSPFNIINDCQYINIKEISQILQVSQSNRNINITINDTYIDQNTQKLLSIIASQEERIEYMSKMITNLVEKNENYKIENELLNKYIEYLLNK